LSIVAVIPARGGSKGIPRKNLVQIAGRPLIAYAIEAAREAPSVDRVIVSTDDSEIATIAIELGAEVPFRRPSELADDTAPMLKVLEHALTWCENNDEVVEALVLLQPTSPARNGRHVQEAINLFRSVKATSVVSVVEVPHNLTPTSLMQRTREGTLRPFLRDRNAILRRQDKPKFYARNGPAVLVCHPATIQNGELYGNCCFPYLMDAGDSIDIDTPQDLAHAEKMLQSKDAE